VQHLAEAILGLSPAERRRLLEILDAEGMA
jgi:hypothetical protein